MSQLVRSFVSMLAELRGAWISGRRVSVSVAGHGRLEGWIARVAATDSFVVVDVPSVVTVKGKRRVRHDLCDVPTERLLAIHNPSVLGDSTADLSIEPWRGRGYAPPPPQLEALFDYAALMEEGER